MESIRVILRRNGPADDVERQQRARGVSRGPASTVTGAASPRPRQEMEQRSPSSRFLPRFSTFSRPTMSSLWSGRTTTTSSPSTQQQPPRPSSSRYSDQSLDSPKTPDPRFSLGMPHMPSTRLHLPNLSRTWSQGSNGPPSRPGTAQEGREEPPPAARPHAASRSAGRGRFPIVTEPAPTVPADHVRGHGRSSSGRSNLRGPDPAEQDLADLAEDGRERRRRRHRHRHHGEGEHGRGEGQEGERRSRRRGDRDGRHRRRQHRGEPRPTPKRFLFCFPWIKSRRIRNQILKCFVSGTFLTLLLTIYLSLSITKNINNSEFTVLLILIILFTTIFFCHGLIRLCMFLIKNPRQEEEEQQRRRERSGEEAAQLFAPGGYAIPREPIRVVLARDEEAVGIESETAKTKPPAYGLWRESVRVDPNRIYWQRNDAAAAPGASSSSSEDDEAAAREDDEGAGVSVRGGGGPGGSGVRRPPSYASDDGVSYVVEAQPRSIAPTTDVPLPQHPSEAGRSARPSPW